MSFTSKRLLTKSMRSALTEGDPYFDSTVLLLHGDGANNSQNNTFLDSSSNNFAITRSGTTSQGSFSPFALNGVAYSPTLHGGSGSFNPSGTLTDYLTLAANNNFAFGTGDFTVEFWMNPTANSPWLSLCGTQPGAITDSRGWNIVITNGSPEIAFWSSAKFIPAAITLNQWTHVSVTRYSGALRMFINGTLTGQTGNGENFTYNQFGVGCTGPGIQPYKGCISNMRIVKGLAVYTSNFTPPTSPVTLTSNGGATPSTAPTSGQVALLCDFTNGGIFDNTKNNNILTPSTAKISTSQVKYGTGAMYFDRTGASSSNITGAYTPKSSSFALPAGTAFTMECWVNLPNVSTTQTIIGIYDTTKFDAFGIFVSNNQLLIQTNGGYSPRPATVNVGSITANTWTHIAVCGTLPNLKAFINGTMYTVTLADTEFCTSGANCYIGYWYPADSTAGTYCTGYIDDLRITKGVARYTSAFTPPARALPDK